MPLPRYSDCEFSLFVSYAHDDDCGNNRWVKRLKDAFWDRLCQLPRDLPFPARKLHLSGVNGPVVGRLGAELEENVRKSFGMLLVVGPRYVDSGWCERELEFFYGVHGQEGFAERLYIAAMTKGAIDEARAKNAWAQLVPADQIWRPFYEEDEPGQPLEPVCDEGGFRGKFWREVCVLADDLIEKIMSDQDSRKREPRATPPAIRVVPQHSAWADSMPPSPVGSDAQLQRRLQVVIGGATGDLLESVGELRRQLVETDELDVTTISGERVAQWEEEGQLASELQGADVFIVPFSEAQPLNPASRDGGHLGIQALEWSRLQKKRPILWYRPPMDGRADMHKASERHMRYIRDLSPVYASSKAIEVALLEPNDPMSRSKIKVYIERNPNERTLWKIIGRRIEQLWKELSRTEGGPPLDVTARSLDIEKLDPHQPVDNADGVVLLFGANKHPTSLRAQIDRVERSVRTSGEPVPFPGFVAVLVPPHGAAEQFPEHDWDYYRFRVGTEPPPPWIRELRPQDTEDVKAFLREIRQRYVERLAMGHGLAEHPE